MSTKRARNWAFVIYPESLPKNWKNIITEIGIPMAVSPLHDKDIDPTGEVKKPHYHCIVTYEGPTSYEVVKRKYVIFEFFLPEVIYQVRDRQEVH